MSQPEQPGKNSRQKRARKAKSNVSGSPNRKAVDPKLLLHDLFDDLEVGLANVMPTGEIVYCNQKFAVTLGNLHYRELPGWKLQQFIAPHSWQSLDTALSTASHERVIGEIKLNPVAGKLQTIRLSMSPVTMMGRPVIRVVADEVTELVESNLQLRETKASLRALSGRILQVQDQERRKMARDLHDTTGQELAVLVMSLRQLASSIDREGVDIHKALLEAADLAQKVNDDIRTLSYVLHPPLLDQLGLGSALSWYVEGFSKRSNIQVKLVVSDELRRFSVEKETALFRVVQEALTNVLRHANTDKAKIVLCASADEVEVTVEDEGKGFSKADVQRLAAPSSDRTVGVGIAGLRERLHQFGGKLEISSRQGGARLRAVVPLNENETGFVTPSLHPPGGDVRTPRSPFTRNNCKRILIADDHEVVRRGIRGLLENYDDLEICGEAQDGFEAVQKTHELHPDLVILDLNMPGSGGLSAASQLQSSGSGVKILIFSMHVLPGLERVLRAAGCKGFVSKLNAERDLLRGIRAILGGGEFFESSPAGPTLAARAQTV